MKNSLLTKSARCARMQIALLLAALVLVFMLSFSLGRYDVPVGQVVKILISRVFPMEASWTKNMEIAVLNVRLPRILLVCMVGCCLAMAGASYQSVFQNPMAAPDILGASSGACFGAALAILLDGSRVMIMVSAFSFSLLTVALVYLIGSRTRGSRTVNILLAGVMISSLFSAGTSYIKLVADPSNQLPAITYWLMGSFSGARMRDVRFAFIPMALGCAPLLRVVGVAPGLTLTSHMLSDEKFEQLHALSPLGRSSRPEDVAATVKFALENPALTGTTILVDGGQHLMKFERDFSLM